MICYTNACFGKSSVLCNAPKIPYFSGHMVKLTRGNEMNSKESCRLIVLLLMMTTFAVPALAQNLSTRSGFELGAQISQYSYKEPWFDLEIGGNKAGVGASYTLVNGGWFLKVDTEVNYGILRYSAARSGVKTGVSDSKIEGRLIGGMDFLLNKHAVVSPYTGLGYRHLFNDIRGRSSNGDWGYRRYSDYLYLPIGVTSRIRIENEWTIILNGEYNYFLRGKQKSMLADTGIRGRYDVTNSQNEGYGMRGSVMMEKRNWSFGPWVQVWNIEKSDMVPYRPNYVWHEPANKTWEVGVEARYHF